MLVLGAHAPTCALAPAPRYDSARIQAATLHALLYAIMYRESLTHQSVSLDLAGVAGGGGARGREAVPFSKKK
eukprot:scaffold27627_cov101-Isochrysis_galbana.AAC.2